MSNLQLMGIELSQIGLNPLSIFSIVFFGVFFLVAFVISSKNMDSDGIMNWMMSKPQDWIGYKNDENQ